MKIFGPCVLSEKVLGFPPGVCVPHFENCFPKDHGIRQHRIQV